MALGEFGEKTIGRKRCRIVLLKRTVYENVDFSVVSPQAISFIRNLSYILHNKDRRGFVQITTALKLNAIPEK